VYHLFGKCQRSRWLFSSFLITKTDGVPQGMPVLTALEQALVGHPVFPAF
jgi:hypothetical protein